MAAAKLRFQQAEVAKTLRAIGEGVALYKEALEEFEACSAPTEAKLVNRGGTTHAHLLTASSRRDKALERVRDDVRRLQKHRDLVLEWLEVESLRLQWPALREALEEIHACMQSARGVVQAAKTKQWSKRALDREEEVTEEERARAEARDWIEACRTRLGALADEAEAEAEALAAGKASRADKDSGAARLKLLLACHRVHDEKLDKLARLIDNELLAPAQIDAIKDDIAYYFDECKDENFDLDASLEVYEPFRELKVKAGTEALAAATAAARERAAREAAARDEESAARVAAEGVEASERRRDGVERSHTPGAEASEDGGDGDAMAIYEDEDDEVEQSEATVALESALNRLQAEAATRSLLLGARLWSDFGDLESKRAGRVRRAGEDEAGAALVAACRTGQESIARMLMDSGADIEAASRSEPVRATPLLLACLCGERGTALALALVHAGANPNAADAAGRSPLVVACYFGLVDVAAALIVSGADLEHRCPPGPAGYTPLMWACGCGRDTISVLLVAHGANIWAEAECGASALLICEANEDNMPITLAGLYEARDAQRPGDDEGEGEDGGEAEAEGEAEGEGEGEAEGEGKGEGETVEDARRGQSSVQRPKQRPDGHQNPQPWQNEAKIAARSITSVAQADLARQKGEAFRDAAASAAAQYKAHFERTIGSDERWKQAQDELLVRTSADDVYIAPAKAARAASGSAAGDALRNKVQRASMPQQPLAPLIKFDPFMADYTGERTLFVKGATPFTTRDDLIDAFSTFGRIVYYNDRHALTKGFVHVHFSTAKECDAAIAVKRIMVPQRALAPDGSSEVRPAVSLLMTACRNPTKVAMA